MQRDKCDALLGQKVREHLVSKGIETPTTDRVSESADVKINAIEGGVRSILETLGLDLTDDSLCDTPRRVAKMYVKELFWGLDYNNFPKCTVIENKMAAPEEFVLERNVKVQSACEHHLVSILGRNDDHGGAVVAYIPRDRVLGLSKINRVVDFFCRRPQVQERLTHQIMEALKFILDTDDVAVYIDAKHLCVSTRGVGDVGSSTVTCAMDGKFVHDDNVRREFLSIARSTFSA
jgi:GTP cyclohydrolase I